MDVLGAGASSEGRLKGVKKLEMLRGNVDDAGFTLFAVLGMVTADE